MRILLSSLLALPVLVLTPGAAVAGGATCLGQPATIVGTGGADDLSGTPLPDVVQLLGGNDRFDGVGGDDLICGGSGADRIAGGPGDDRISGDAGRDHLAGGVGDDVLIGGAGSDSMSGGDDADLVRGGGSADFIAEGPGDDRITGGTGTDRLSYQPSATPVEIRVATGRADGAGADRFGQVELFDGSTFADLLVGGPSSDWLAGGGGKDRLVGRGGDDLLFATSGSMKAGAGADLLSLRGPSDSGRLTATGGKGADVYEVASATSVATVRAGSDDRVTLNRLRRSATVNVGRGTARWEGGSLRFGGTHYVIGTRRADLMIGSGGNDILDGGRGDDVLRGRGGSDFLMGRGGFDRAYGDAGWDICLTEVRLRCET